MANLALDTSSGNRRLGQKPRVIVGYNSSLARHGAESPEGLRRYSPIHQDLGAMCAVVAVLGKHN
jgi:hypothetical protein